MSKRLILGLLLASGAVLQAADGVSPFIRVAILRSHASLGSALAQLSEREYQGTIQVLWSPTGSCVAVNTLDIEDYLLGVVGREMDPNGPLEALKAQAVAARTHALFEASTHRDQPYDLVANISQAYFGKDRLRKNVVLAIEATRGEVLHYEGQLFPAFFHSSCGGATDSAADIWQMTRRLAGGGVLAMPSSVPCPACAASSENHWRLEMSAATLQRALNRAGYDVKGDLAPRVTERTAGGRALRIVVGRGAGEKSFTGEKFREILGYAHLKSTAFRIRRPALPDGMPGDSYLFEGNGYGHGVGLCQFGACAMAARGARYGEILNAYFPKAQIRPATFQSFASAR